MPEEVVVETRASRLREVEGGFDTTLQIINERSAEAGYPDNPTSEEIETQYFDVADIYSSGETTAREALGESSAAPADRVAPTADGTARATAAPVSLPISETVSGAMTAAPQAATAPTPQAPVSMPTPRASGRRARISIQMTAAEYLRLKLGAAVLGFDEADLINTALTEYLDNWGVDSLDDCAKLKGAVELFESAGSNDD